MTGFHLNVSLMTPGHFRHAWRLPHADPLAYLDIEHFRRLARVAEEAKIDAVFLGDAPALRGEIEDAPGTGLDPLVLLGAVAATTTRLGVVVAGSPPPTTRPTTWRAVSGPRQRDQGPRRRERGHHGHTRRGGELRPASRPEQAPATGARRSSSTW